MKLTRLELNPLEIPFRVSFKHASAERTSTETVIATATSVDGINGYGEGCPRHYVTGENVQSCYRFLEQHHHEILQVSDIASLTAFVTAHRLAIDQNPAAWCAIETALLDLLGQTTGKSIEAVIGIPEIQGSYQYTAVFGVSNPKVFEAQLAQYLHVGFNDFKVKLSGDRALDAANLNAILTANPFAKIRLDANNFWNDANAAIEYLTALPSLFWAVEEPIQVRDYVGLNTIADKLSCKIILDESFLKLEDFDFLSGNFNHWIPNIRISKMGGLLRSLAIAEECTKRGLQFIVGAQVGETSILSRVALSLANMRRNALAGQEGAYSTHLLERDVVANPIMFGKAGRIISPVVNAPGLGLDWAW